jgi:cation diffusion facilitator CzcD-associated flavoprotein CzcO
MATTVKSMPIAIIGAGLGGLAAAIKLKEAGYTEIVILEKDSRVGGTWSQNTYPGCSCDVPVALYQYSFAPWFEWTNTFPSSSEIQRYSEYLVDGFGLRPHLHLSTEATSAVWDATTATWTITASNGRTWQVAAIVGGLGQLNRPSIPALPGLETFAGPTMHSAGWDHSVDMTGKRVGVVGSAASAVQLIPEVAKVAGQLVVFQRSANWVAPRGDRVVSDQEKALLMTNPAMAMDMGARNRQLIFDNAETFFWQAFSYTPEGREAYAKIARDHLEAQVSDPVLRAKLTPEFPVGCKRYLFTDVFYPAMTQPHVTLETDPIATVTAKGIATATGTHHDLDILVFATGFETTGWHWSVDVQGVDGQHLNTVWADGPTAYLGITAAGFPNFFMLYGPHTNLGHNSITYMMERQIEYLIQALDGLSARGATVMDVKADAQSRFYAQLSADLASTTWADPGCNSWYKNDKGVVTQNWSGNCTAYAEAVKAVVWDDYETA